MWLPTTITSTPGEAHRLCSQACWDSLITAAAAPSPSEASSFWSPLQFPCIASTASGTCKTHSLCMAGPLQLPSPIATAAAPGPSKAPILWLPPTATNASDPGPGEAPSLYSRACCGSAPPPPSHQCCCPQVLQGSQILLLKWTQVLYCLHNARQHFLGGIYTPKFKVRKPGVICILTVWPQSVDAYLKVYPTTFPSVMLNFIYMYMWKPGGKWRRVSLFFSWWLFSNFCNSHLLVGNKLN